VRREARTRRRSERRGGVVTRCGCGSRWRRLGGLARARASQCRSAVMGGSGCACQLWLSDSIASCHAWKAARRPRRGRSRQSRRRTGDIRRIGRRLTWWCRFPIFLTLSQLKWRMTARAAASGKSLDDLGCMQPPQPLMMTNATARRVALRVRPSENRVADGAAPHPPRRPSTVRAGVDVSVPPDAGPRCVSVSAGACAAPHCPLAWF
jgi:hypothetical protein